MNRHPERKRPMCQPILSGASEVRPPRALAQTIGTPRAAFQHEGERP